MLAITGLEPMELRWEALNAKFHKRIQDLPGSFMVAQAQNEHMKSKYKYAASIFGTKWYNSVYFDIEVSSSKSPTQIIKEAKVAAYAGLWTEETKARLAAISVHVDAKVRLKSLRCLAFADHGVYRWILRWIMRSPFGQPMRCLNCMAATATVVHVQECCNLDIDAFCRVMNWRAASAAIKDVALFCYGWTLPHLRGLTPSQDPQLVKNGTNISADPIPAGFRPGPRAHGYWRVHLHARPGMRFVGNYRLTAVRKKPD
jgi:hypothetical protein